MSIWRGSALKAGRVARLYSGSQPVMCAAWGLNGDLVAGGSSDRVARVWDVATERVRHKLTGHTNKIFHCLFVGAGKQHLLLTGSADRSIRAVGPPNRVLPENDTPSICLCFDSFGTALSFLAIKTVA